MNFSKYTDCCFKASLHCAICNKIVTIDDFCIAYDIYSKAMDRAYAAVAVIDARIQHDMCIRGKTDKVKELSTWTLFFVPNAQKELETFATCSDECHVKFNNAKMLPVCVYWPKHPAMDGSGDVECDGELVQCDICHCYLCDNHANITDSDGELLCDACYQKSQPVLPKIKECQKQTTEKLTQLSALLEQVAIEGTMGKLLIKIFKENLPIWSEDDSSEYVTADDFFKWEMEHQHHRHEMPFSDWIFKEKFDAQ